MKSLKSLLLFCLLLLAFSCARTQDASDDAVGADGTVTLTMLNYNDLTSPEARQFDAILAAFTKKYPEVKFKIETMFNEPFFQKTAALAASGQLPDVMMMWPGGRSENLMKNDLVQDLYPFLGKDRNNFLPSAIQPQHDGKLFELPAAITASHVMFVNKAILARLGLSIPKTYNELVAMVPKLKAAGLEPVLMAGKDPWVLQSCLFSTIVGRIASTKWLRNAVAGKASFTEKPFVDSLKFLKKMFDDKVLSLNCLQTSYGEGPGLFVSGKAAFFIDGDWRVGALAPIIPAGQENDFVMIVLPAIPGETEGNSTSVVTGTGFAMNVKLKGEKAKAAWKWISFYAGPEASLMKLQLNGEQPAYKVDTSGLKLSSLVQQRIKFFATHRSTDVLDNVIGTKPIEVVNNGLQALALGSITAEKLAADVQKAMEQDRAGQ